MKYGNIILVWWVDEKKGSWQKIKTLHWLSRSLRYSCSKFQGHKELN